MAATKISRNDTPNTPDVAESKIARMKVAELRRRLRDHGVRGIDDVKKPELVKKLIKAETSGGKKKSASAKKSVSASAKPSASTKSGKNRTSRNDTPENAECR